MRISAAGDAVMDQLPVFFNVKDQWVAVVGGGIAAARKAEVALQAGARIKVFAEELSAEFDKLKAQGRFVVVPRVTQAQDFDGCALVYCASDDIGQNRDARALAKMAGVPCNVVDMPELCPSSIARL
jgi:uroporphyrin-III C-methyltransferase/precorrin-2 dehydrogenase/sirohydrochlorin ferrochelatase